jgi:hypothetical protein
MVGFRLAANFGTIEGDDAIIKGAGGLEEARKKRNSNFKSKIQEVFLLAEFYPTVLFEYESSDIYHKFRPYVVAGIGAFHFNPQGLDLQTNEWVYLRPLHTKDRDSQNSRPQRIQTYSSELSVGYGFKYFASENDEP